MSDITLDGPKTVTLTPATLQAIVVGLNELPRKISQPAIEELLPQLVSPPGTDVGVAP